MRPRVIFSCVCVLFALVSFGCGDGDGGASTLSVGTSAASSHQGPVASVEDTLDASPGATEFLARSGFLGYASINDRALDRNGTKLVYHSLQDLLPGDSNVKSDIYFRDLRSGEVKVVSVGVGGTQSNGNSSQAGISPDGRYVVFRSAASNLVPNDTNGKDDIFRRDLVSGITERVSVDSAQAQAIGGDSITPAVSHLGRYVVFASTATNLVSQNTNGVQHIFVRDMQAGTTTLLSTEHAGTGNPANGASFDPTITPDGKFVAFSTDATNIIQAGVARRQIIKLEREDPDTRSLVSQGAGGFAADGHCYEPSISDDGNKIAFFTLAKYLGETLENDDFFDVYVRDELNDTTTRVSVNSSDEGGNGHSGFPSISGDGSVVAFGSLASNLVVGDGNNNFDVFTRSGTTTTMESVSTSGIQGGSDTGAGSDICALSLSGSYVAFRSSANNLVPYDNIPDDDIIVRHRSLPNISTFWGSISGLFPAIWPGFGTVDSSLTDVGISPSSVALGDINGDGYPDIVTANSGSHNVSVLLQDLNSVGSFLPPTTLGVGTGPYAVAVGDVNGDGYPDIVTANSSFNTVSVLLQDPINVGSFLTPITLGVGSQPRSVALGDVNGDGRLDIVTANYASSTVSILLQDTNSVGSFLTHITLGVGTGPYAVAMGDLNRDGRLDIVTANYNYDNQVSVLLQNNAGFTLTNFHANFPPSSVALGDVDGDGRLDIVTASTLDDNVSVLLQDPANVGSFLTHATLGVGATPYSVTLGDVDGDGRLDIVTANANSANVSVLRQNPANVGSFFPHATFGAGQTPYSVALGDLDLDGDLDLVVVNYIFNGGTVRVRENLAIP